MFKIGYMIWLGTSHFSSGPHLQAFSIPHQGGVTPIESIVITATAYQNLDRLFSVV